ncbi:hypothetical protein HanRHA438_Chr01g0000541 [Helianthus annuus]|nr:hypothetical protein HanIR_Chr01g0000591 [Helianthus annuus]KAJ0946124.1 hypothetical protein HanRHA438_Chr01g0000541 [Helianthus annuus]KAJ0955214.1 hypothetical protein HanPSC8_Chr01g0000331 [Helianthus annuus]
MAYRRRQGLSRSSTFNEEILRQPENDDATTSSAALPHRASEPRLDSFHSFKNRSKSSVSFDNVLMKSKKERGGFWGVLARKAKSILEDEGSKKSNTRANASKKPETISFSTNSQFTGIQVQHQCENSKKMDTPTLRMGLDRHRLKPSLNQIGDAIGNALEAEKKTQNTIQETHNLQDRRAFDNQEKNQGPRLQSAQAQRNQETQLQASRDVALAKAAKVKQLARELKTATAELASAKERCCQLEQENKLLQEAQEKGDHPSEDDMIRLQLETLLAEKGRLAHENSVYARENRYLREIVEFHQMKMQDMLYLDEDIIETSYDLVEELVTSARFDLESPESMEGGGFPL